jgi:A/G-specific adenine glycosylase
MELGATVCTPRDPRCGECPIAGLCAARASGRERALPVVAPKKAVPLVEVVAVVIRDASSGALLLARRREGGLFGGLWEPPMVEALSLAEARPALSALGLTLGPARLREVGRVTHVLTHRRMEVLVATATRGDGTGAAAALNAPYEKAAWLDPGAPGVGVSTLARKVIEALDG